MEIRPIRNEDDYKEALEQIEELMGAGAGTPEGGMLDALATSIEAYERNVCPVDNPDPIEVIKFYMEQNGLRAKDPLPMIGQKNTDHETLNP